MISEKVHGCLVCTGVFMLMFAFGNVYTVGNMTPYLLSYINKFVDPGNVENSMSIWLSALIFAAEGLVTPFIGVILPYTGFRPLVITGCILNIIGNIATSFTLNVNFVCVVFTYAALVGISVGSTYGLLLSIACSWFPKKEGAIVGICSCGFGAGAIVLTPIQTLMINPENFAVNNITQMFDQVEMLQRVPRTMQIIGGVLAGIQLIGCLLVRPRPVKENVRSENEDGDHSKKNLVETDKSPKQVLKGIDIYIFWFMMFLCLMPLTLITATVKIVGQKSIPDDSFLSIVGLLGALVNTFSRLFWGPIGDAVSFKVPLFILNLFYATTLITLPFIPQIPVAGKYLYAIWVMLCYLFIAGNFVLMCFGVNRSFGPKYFTANYGLVFSAFTPGCLIGAVIIYCLKLEVYQTEIFIGCGVACLLNSLLAAFLHDSTMPQRLRPLFCYHDVPKSLVMARCDVEPSLPRSQSLE